MIRTVLGDIPAQNLKHTQCHEHLFLQKGRSFEISPVLWMEDVQKSTQELVDYKQAGGSAVVDAQPVLCGRMAANLVTASQKSGVCVIASTGFHKTRFYAEGSALFSLSEQSLTDLFIDEITQGMCADDDHPQIKIAARAGVLKTAVDAGGLHADKTYEKLFWAALNTAKQTGVPVLCHIEQGADANEVAAFFLDGGIPARKIILCHLDRARYDAAYHRELLQTGVYFDYDTINRTKYLSNEQEIALITGMLAQGFAEQLLLSLDTTNARLRSYGGSMGLDYILTTFVPMLKQAGVSREEILLMTQKNAQRVLDF